MLTLSTISCHCFLGQLKILYAAFSFFMFYFSLGKVKSLPLLFIYCLKTKVLFWLTASAESFLFRMWLNGTLAVSTPSWTLWRVRVGSRSKELTHHTFISGCGRVPLHGTLRTWICTASTTCILESPSPGTVKPLFSHILQKKYYLDIGQCPPSEIWPSNVEFLRQLLFILGYFVKDDMWLYKLEKRILNR